MNQNNRNQQTQYQQMSQEELQKTQVLNLQDVEETIKFEKLTSKKPAIIVALIGAFSILMGSGIFAFQTLSAKEPTPTKDKTTIEKKEVVSPESYLNCTYTTLNKADGTDTILNVNLTFNYDKLVKIAKTFSINPTVGNPLGPTTVQAYITGYQPFLVQAINGYQMNAVPANDGLVVTSQVDLAIFDPNTLPELHRGNVATSVEYTLNTEKQTIYNDLQGKGFTCQ